MKNSNCKQLFVAVFLVTLLASSAYAALIPAAYAAQQPILDKGLSVLSNVVGLNLTKYSVDAKDISADNQASLFGDAPKKDVEYELTSGESNLKTLYTFVDGKLEMIHVFEIEGTPSLTKPATANAVEMAQDFLDNYRAYTGDSLYGQLKSTLHNVDAGKNATKESGNTQLEVSSTNGYTAFKWTYAFNGVKAPSKFVALGFNNSFLTYFVDNWQFYGIGCTSINLSKEEAIATALTAAKAHSWSLTLDDDTLNVNNFNESNVRWTALIFDDSLSADKTRSEDALTVYPVWRVGIALDKWYGYMYGIEVDVWADTEEVRRVQEAWSTLPPPEKPPTASISTADASANPMWIALPMIAFAMTGSSLVWVAKKEEFELLQVVEIAFC